MKGNKQMKSTLGQIELAYPRRQMALGCRSTIVEKGSYSVPRSINDQVVQKGEVKWRRVK